jgi:LmbE family N-acetylglucosaminyl deacetylase
MLRFCVGLLVPLAVMLAQEGPLRVIAFGAHPDDCDIRAAGTAAKFRALGAAVKFVSVTNGDAGHQSMGGGALAKRRRGEAEESGRRLGITYEVLDNHDGELLPTIAVREQIIRRIRQWNADIVLAPRPNDYHPDHRYTGVLVQDAAYMVVVPNVCPDTPPLRKNPVFLYYEDRFQKPAPFRPDVAIGIDDVFDLKVAALDAHVSQVYEWLPWWTAPSIRCPKIRASANDGWPGAARTRSRRMCAVLSGSGTGRSARRRCSTPRHLRFANMGDSRATKICAGFFPCSGGRGRTTRLRGQTDESRIVRLHNAGQLRNDGRAANLGRSRLPGG